MTKESLFDEDLSETSTFRPNSRQNLICAIENMLGNSLINIIDTHNTQSIIFIFKSSENKYVIKAEYGENTHTHQEISWYKEVALHAPNLSAIFSDSFVRDNFALLLLQYVENSATVDELVLNGKLDSEKAGQFILNAINIDQSLFQSKLQTTNKGQADQFFVGKYLQRRKQAQKIQYLDKILSAPFVNINGRFLVGPERALTLITEDDKLHDKLTPSNLGLIHGDLNCANMLLKEIDRLYLVDPNGNLNMPIEYDYGKMFHSIHGGYGLIMRGKYQLRKTEKNNYEFNLEMPQAYTNAYAELVRQMTFEKHVRGLYAEAIHFVTMLPHHAANEQETLALFLRSTQIFSELFEHLDFKSNTKI